MDRELPQTQEYYLWTFTSLFMDVRVKKIKHELT